MRRRTLGRELALKFLYSQDLKEASDLEGFELFAIEQEKRQEARDFARELVEGVNRDPARLRREIETRASNWTWSRMPVVDRVLLLIGAHELLDREDIPSSVTINEIVDLAKRFSTAGSGAFVNGVLDALAKTAGKKSD